MLRSALSLSACTGQPFRIKNIRAGRKKPGLMRQHLTCVRAAEAVCGGKSTGASLGSTELAFAPGEPSGGAYTFDVGTAGATALVFQTILPILLMADEPSTVEFRGGTHTIAAPSLDFIEQAFLPPLQTMGADVSVHRQQLGFYPAGGGLWTSHINPLQQPRSLTLENRGALIAVEGEALRANLPEDICQREIDTLMRNLNISENAVRMSEHKGPGPGNAVLVHVQCEHHSEVFSAIGRHGVKAETVAANAAREAKQFLASNAAVSDFLADQLLLPMALFQGGSFTAGQPSGHFLTNVETIQSFLDVSIAHEAKESSIRVSVERS